MKHIGRLLLVLAALFVAERHAVAQFGPAPRVSEERVVFHTVAGPLVFELFPDAAPRTVKQFLTLVKAGAYDGTHFGRNEVNFVLQLSSVWDRTVPLTPEQQQLVTKLPLEIARGLHHDRGILSIAREIADPNSGESSFSILLGPAPHLDGQYAIFGRLASGAAVLSELLRVPVDVQKKPTYRLEVLRAEVVTDREELAKHYQNGLRAERLPVESAPTLVQRPDLEPAAFGLAIVLVILTVQIMFDTVFSARVRTSINMLGLFMGFFVLLISLIPSAQFNRYLALTLFLGLLLIIRLLGNFDSPRSLARPGPKEKAQ